MSATIYSNKFEAFTVGDFPWGWVQGPTTTLTVQLGAASLKSLRVNTGGWGAGYLPYSAFQHRDIDVTARISTNSRGNFCPRWGGNFQAGGTIGLPADCLFIQCIPSNNSIDIGYYDTGGGYGALGATTLPAGLVGSDYTERVVCNGTNVKIWLNDVLVLDVTDNLSTKAGFCFNNYGGSLDLADIKFSDPNKNDPLGLG